MVRVRHTARVGPARQSGQVLRGAPDRKPVEKSTLTTLKPGYPYAACPVCKHDVRAVHNIWSDVELGRKRGGWCMARHTPEGGMPFGTKYPTCTGSLALVRAVQIYQLPGGTAGGHDEQPLAVQNMNGVHS